MAEFYRRDGAPAMFLSAANFYVKIRLANREKSCLMGVAQTGVERTN
jgi:hypothetical protein